MIIYDLAVFWEWDYDTFFNTTLQKIAQLYNLKIIFIDPALINVTERALAENEIFFKWYLDRASETDARFLNLVQICQLLKINSINPFSHVHRALSKSYMHKLLYGKNIPLPETIVIPSYKSKIELPFFTFANIGIPFVLKPANGGGGDGVHMGLTEISQIELYRKEYPDSEYLIQQTIIPKIKDNRPIWLRVFFVCDEIFFSFWNPQTKIFSLINKTDNLPNDKLLDDGKLPDVDEYIIQNIKNIIIEIAKISKMRFFSSEVAVNPDNCPIVIDYVNDPVDLRPKSSHKDGMPDELLEKIVFRLINFINT